MSRTDVHRPIFVQIRDMPPGVRVHHDHTKGPCDFDPNYIGFGLPRWGRRYADAPQCQANLPFYGWPNTKHWGNAHHHKACKNQYHRRERARWLVKRSRLLSRDPWDVEDELGFRPRGSVAWDEW